MSKVVLFAAIAAGILAAGKVVAQYPNSINGQNYNNPYGDLSYGGNPYGNNEEEGQQEDSRRDTTQRRPRRPLESYFFDDSTRSRPNFSWTVDMSRNQVTMVEIDTMLNDFQIIFPSLREDVGDARTGPLGGGTIPLNYIRRPDENDFTFARPFYSTVFTPESAPFYNVKKPFTHLTYAMSGQKTEQEEILRVIHAQNISPSTGFNVNYTNHNTRGMYKWQTSKNKNLSLALSHTGKRYTLHTGYIYNMASTRDNGGMIDPVDLRDRDIELSRNIPVRMTSPENLLKNNTYYLVQSYGFPLRRLTDEDFSIAKHPTIFLGNAFEYSRHWKRYTDTRDGTIFQVDHRDENGEIIEREDVEFYENWFINPTMSNDSIFESRLSNRIFMQIQPWDRDAIIGTIDGGIGVDSYVYSYFTLRDYITGRMEKDRRISYYVYGGLRGKFRRYMDWGAAMKYIYGGYRSGDLDMNGNVAFSAFFRGRPVTISGRLMQRIASPGYWDNTMFSNHFAWSNNFGKESETRLEAKLAAPFLGMEAGVWQSVISNKVYYNALAQPAQNSGTVSLTGIYIQEYFRFGGLNLNHRILVQASSDQNVIPVPLASAFLSYFYEFDIVRNVLKVRMGLDGRYQTAYYGFAYNPATTQFYNQRQQQIADYPMVDVFVTAKWKRMRILVKMEHLNQGWIETQHYFDILRYPLNQRLFKIGISWGFYD